MTRRPVLLFLFLTITHALIAQVLPKEGSLLNYRLIGFSFPTVKQVSKYRIEIAAGYYNTEDSFKKNIIKTIDCKTGKTISEVPSFGKQYTWSVVPIGGDGAKTIKELYHFSTGTIPEADTSNSHLRIIKTAKQYKDAYVFVDCNRTLYDMSGNPIWYLPYINGSTTGPADLKLSSQGTITFMLGVQAYEVNYNGDVLWKAPNNGIVSGDTSSEHYHHEFTRLANGHYMILGSTGVPRPMPVNGRDNNILKGNNIKAGPESALGTIIEYNEKGNVVWYWKSSKYFTNSDISNFENPGYYQNPPSRELEVHENAFFFDEASKMIYIGFKNVSRIIKVKYPEGTVTNVYGEIFRQGIPEKGNGMFCGQHACGVTHTGDLFVFNNNDCNWPDYPSIVIMHQPASEKDTLKKIWEYTYDPEGTSAENIPGNKSYHRTSGGNAIELPDGSMFASLYAPYCNVFIVNRSKELLWSAIAEKWDGSKWLPKYLYRASIISNPKDLERLIWNLEQSSGNIQ